MRGFLHERAGNLCITFAIAREERSIGLVIPICRRSLGESEDHLDIFHHVEAIRFEGDSFERDALLISLGSLQRIMQKSKVLLICFR